MPERRRLSLLEVGVGRDHRFGVDLCDPGERSGEPVELHDAFSARPAQIETEVKDDLVVSGPTGVKFPGDFAHNFVETALDSAVDVLVGLGKGKLSRLRLDEDLGQPVNDHIRLVLVDDTGIAKHAGVGKRAFNVHCEKPPVRIVNGERPGALGR
jgi:hypothetical protein